MREHGQPVPEETLEPSDVILPPPDVSFEEARAEFSGEGLIPRLVRPPAGVQFQPT